MDVNEPVRLPRLLSKALQNDHSHLLERSRLHPATLSAELNITPLSRVTMKLLPGQDEIVPGIHDLVEVFGHNGSLGIYRVASVNTGYRKDITIQLNHGLDVLSDAMIAEDTTISGTVQSCIQQFLAAQTANIGGEPYWRLGTCEDTNQYIAQVRYTNVMQLLTDLAKKEDEYYFSFDQTVFPWRLDFLRRPTAVGAEFRLSRNLQNCAVTYNDNDLCTRLYLSVTTETETENGKTNTTVHELHDDPEGQARWGIIAQTAGINLSQVPDKTAYINAYFRKRRDPALQIQISGQEINRLTGETWDEMDIGRRVRVAIPESNAWFEETLVSVKYTDILRRPRDITVSLSNKKETSDGTFSSLSSRTSSLSSQAEATSNDVQNAQTKIVKQGVDLVKTEGALRGEIEFTAEHLTATFTDADRQLAGQLELTAEHLQTTFTDDINGLRGEVEVTAAGIRADYTAAVGDLSSHLELTASQLRLDFEAGDAQLSSNLELTAEHLETTFENRAKGLESTIEATAESLTVDYVDRVNNVQSNLTITANSLQNTISDLDGNIKSQIKQLDDEIELKATKTTVDGQFEVVNGNITAVNGRVTALSGKFDTLESSFNSTTRGYAASFYTASLVADLAAIPSLSCTTFLVGGSQYTAHAIKMGSAVNATGNLAQNDVDINHYHSITITESSGTVTVKIGQASATEGSATFNIADTKFYKDAIASAKASMGVLIDGEYIKVGTSATKAIQIGCGIGQLSYNSSTHKYSTYYYATAGSTIVKKVEGHVFDNTQAYDAGKADGAADVTLAKDNMTAVTTYNPSSGNYTVTVSCTLSNGSTQSKGFVVTPTEALHQGWEDYYNSGSWAKPSYGNSGYARIPSSSYKQGYENWFRVTAAVGGNWQGGGAFQAVGEALVDGTSVASQTKTFT